jgi:hypothetical protein
LYAAHDRVFFDLSNPSSLSDCGLGANYAEPQREPVSIFWKPERELNHVHQVVL